MRKFIPFLFYLLITSGISFSQEEKFRIPAGTTVNSAIPLEHQYEYLEFIKGKVFFRDGKVSAVMLNYNRITDEIHFISTTGDTLAIDNAPTLRFVLINTDSFFYDGGYIRLLKSYEGLSLGLKHHFQITGKIKIGAYDSESPTSSITSYDSYFDERATYKLNVKEITILAKRTTYYFGERFNHFIRATKKNLIGLFPDCRTEIRKFCRKNNLDFSDEAQLIMLIRFVKMNCK